MASQVKDEDVDTLMAITSQLSRDQAVRFLKVGDGVRIQRWSRAHHGADFGLQRGGRPKQVL